MAAANGKTATPAFPKFEFPKYDDAAMKSLFKDNLEVAVKAQRLMLDAAEAMMKRQFELTREMVEKSQAAVVNFDVNKKPEVYVEEVKAAAERAQTIVKEEIDNGVKVQQDVADLVTKRVTANVDEIKKFAA